MFSGVAFLDGDMGNPTTYVLLADGGVVSLNGAGYQAAFPTKTVSATDYVTAMVSGVDFLPGDVGNPITYVLLADGGVVSVNGAGYKKAFPTRTVSATD